MKILLTGKAGQLGWELVRTLAPLGELTAVDRHGLDLTDSAAIASAVRQLRPNLIVNTAAYTAVDRAQTESATAHAVNATAPEILAREARALGAVLVHFSTDYVFDGKQSGPYEETDVCAPASVYGQTKLAGEEAIVASGAAHLVLRTSWVYAARGSNFLLTMLRLARSKPELAVVADQFGAPTWARMIAEATALILARCGTTPRAILDALGQHGGIYHLSAAGRTSWHGFAEAIMREAGLAIPVRAITTTDYPLPAPRPANSVLANGKLAKQFGVALPGWEIGVRQCVEELALRDSQHAAAGAASR